MEPQKSYGTFADRDFVFEAARIVFRGSLVRRQDTRRRRSKEPRFMVLDELYGRVMVIIYAPRNRKCRIISMRPANALSARSIISARPDKPREYFAKLLDMPEDKIEYSEIPPTTAADWEDAEVLLPVTTGEFRTIKHFIERLRKQSAGATDPISSGSERNIDAIR